MRRLMIICVAAVLLPASIARGQDPRDTRLADEIASAVMRYAQLSIFDDISAQVEHGVVTLSGKVTMPYKKTDLGKRISRIDGVSSVRNGIDVLPVSGYDEELRYRIARAIYGNPSFWSYAAMSRPPIHIIVEHGHVTLAGVVSSNVDRMLARSLATGLGELSVTSTLKTDAEIRSELRSALRPMVPSPLLATGSKQESRRSGDADGVRNRRLGDQEMPMMFETGG